MTTGIDVLGELANGLGTAFRQAQASRQLLFGFAEHVVSTTYLGSSTGLRRRGVQPTGRLELNAKAADLSASAWVGRATRDFTDLDIAEVVAEAEHPAGLGEGQDRPAARGRTRRCCRPARWPTC